MSWNYRVMAWEQEENPYLQIHSVHYNENGIPKAYSERGEWVGGDTIEELDACFNLMKLALKKPILLAGDKFPKEYKPTPNYKNFIKLL